MIELTKESVTVAPPGEGECEICDGILDRLCVVGVVIRDSAEVGNLNGFCVDCCE